jgi:2-C-methyl-D-erythritol 4-phosphate cytidylyltransferase
VFFRILFWRSILHRQRYDTLTGMPKTTEKTSVSAIILAGGSGLRAGKIYKQFLKIHRKPVLHYSLEKFLKSPLIQNIIIVVPKVYMEESGILKNIKHEGRVHIIEGGSSRRESAFKGLSFIRDNNMETEFLIIHDAARPMVSKKVISAVLKETIEHGAATVGIPAIDLLFEVENNFVSKAHNKKGFYYGFTPQSFSFKDILKAHIQSKKDELLGDVDNIELMKRYCPKVTIKILDTFYPNIKLTYKEDVHTVKHLLKKK